MRNIYETRIGRFDKPNARVQVIDPCTRKFSDFSRVVDKLVEEIKSKKVLMYCTGGVRCERASSYLKLKGIEDVYQLNGGIHSYQETFPDGGLFKGKNFVYDPRISVPYANCNSVIGRCMICDSPADDYRPQIRCKSCRMLVLVCVTCIDSSKDNAEFQFRLYCEQCVCADRMTVTSMEPPPGCHSKPKKSRADCKKFSAGQYCKFGDSCRFSHSNNSSSSSSSSEFS